jgi:tRNA(Ile)-lysidine synthase
LLARYGKNRDTLRVSEFLQHVEKEIQTRKLLSRGQKILVAVSGGVDSMVLLHTLHSLAEANRWLLSVAHFNHRLRGRASDADEKLVRSAAKKLRLNFFGDSADVKVFAKRSKLSIEMAARKLRHEFLARIAREQKILLIALAHHADDQVELFFLRLLRGAGTEGLTGMRWRSTSPADKTVSLVRPLLGFMKLELLGFAAENKIRFRDDATNASEDFLRNRVRNELLPLLQKKYSPQITKSVLRTMDIIGAESDFMTLLAARIRGGKSETGRSFETLPVAIQRRILRQELVAVRLMPEFELVEQLRLAEGKAVSIDSNLCVVRDANGKIQMRQNSEMEFSAGESKLRLRGRAGQMKFVGLKFSWSRTASDGSRARIPRHTELFDADVIGSEIILRHWRAGDRFQPIGMKSPVKLQDLFVNAKIPAARRRELVLATTAAGTIFWVEGLRISEVFKLTPQTKRLLRWEWTKIGG